MNNTPEMSPVRSGIAFWTWCFVLVLLPVFSHAGGLGSAPLAAIIGGAGFLTVTAKPDLKAVPAWVWAALIFLTWAWITSGWSPYQDNKTLTNPVKVVLGFLLYLGAFAAADRLSETAKKRLSGLLTIVIMLIPVLIAIDLSTGLKLTHLVDPVKTGENLRLESIQTIMNLGHSMAIFVLLFPLLGFILVNNFAKGFIIALGVGLFGFAQALIGGFNVGILALPLIGIFVFLAARFPIAILKFLFGLMIVLILFAPAIGLISAQVPAEMKNAMPASWEHRLVMWDYVTHQIFQAPLWGHGFDASRTFDATFDSNLDLKMTIVSLHPHNFGLHIWLETGVIGAVLAAGSVFMMGRAVLKIVRQYQSFAAPTSGFVVGLIVIGSVSYGIWQEWLWAIIIMLSALYYGLARSGSAQ